MSTHKWQGEHYTKEQVLAAIDRCQVRINDLAFSDWVGQEKERLASIDGWEQAIDKLMWLIPEEYPNMDI